MTAIKKAEEELEKSGTLYCLGDIVHNSDEVQRLSEKGLKIITHEEMAHLKDVKVLLRAHGEPPSTYGLAQSNNIDIIDKVDFNRPIALYSQTTKSLTGFQEVIDEIKRRMAPGIKFESFDTICRQVANRVEKLQRFAEHHDVILFVAGNKSSNGKVLYANCLEVNPRTHLIANASEIKPEWLADAESIGICGATSTPRWLMEEVKWKILSL